MATEPDNGSEPQNVRSELERFERLAQRLLAVPKAEIDELEKKRKRRRSRKPHPA